MRVNAAGMPRTVLDCPGLSWADLGGAKIARRAVATRRSRPAQAGHRASTAAAWEAIPQPQGP